MTVVYTFFETMDELRSVLTTQEVVQFEACWSALDPLATGYISKWKLPSLVERREILIFMFHLCRIYALF